MVGGQPSPSSFYIRRDVTVHWVGQEFCTSAFIHPVAILIDVESWLDPNPRAMKLLSQGSEIGLTATPRDWDPYGKAKRKGQRSSGEHGY